VRGLARHSTRSRPLQNGSIPGLTLNNLVDPGIDLLLAGPG